MAKCFPVKYSLNIKKFHQLKTLANIISNTEDVLHTSAKKEGGGFFIKQLIGKKIAYLSKYATFIYSLVMLYCKITNMFHFIFFTYEFRILTKFRN